MLCWKKCIGYSNAIRKKCCKKVTIHVSRFFVLLLSIYCPEVLVLVFLVLYDVQIQYRR